MMTYAGRSCCEQDSSEYWSQPACNKEAKDIDSYDWKEEQRIDDAKVSVSQHD